MNGLDEEAAAVREEGVEKELERLTAALLDAGVPDALQLRRVLRLRELVQEFDRELSGLQTYFTGSAQTPPS